MPDCQVLDVPPVEVGVGLEDEGDDAGGHGRASRGSRVRGRAVVMEVRRHHLPLAGRAGAVGGGQGAGARLRVPGRKGGLGLQHT